MKYRGVKIGVFEWLYAVDVGKRENSPIKPIYCKGYTPGPIREGCRYPNTLTECKQTIDQLIPQIMSCCSVTEKMAVKLINEEIL